LYGNNSIDGDGVVRSNRIERDKKVAKERKKIENLALG